ncbi:MAG: hypothetical protein H7061_07210 [Bdellovibrionaceae bacterium]|nr:hypothetical protein [Bdellovibrio sp.]
MNQRGQALIEMLILSSIIIVAVIWTVRLGVLLHINIAVDEMIEITHLCEIQKKSDCQSQLEKNLRQLGLTKNSLIVANSNNQSRIWLNATTSLGQQFVKESELKLGLTVSQ